MCNPTFKIALESGTDFTDTAMMHVWHIAEYANLKRLGLPSPYGGIRIENYGEEDSVCLTEDLLAFMEENDIHPSWMAKDGA